MASDSDRVNAVTNNLVTSGFVDTSIPGAASQTHAVWSQIVPGLMIGGGGPRAYGMLEYSVVSGSTILSVAAGSVGITSATVRPTGVRLVLEIESNPKTVVATPYGIHANGMMMIDVVAMGSVGSVYRLDLRYLGATITGTGSQTWAAMNQPPGVVLSGILGRVIVGVW